MRLKNHPQTLEDRLLEFDTWITASLSEIKDSDQFKSARECIANIIEVIGESTSWFESDLSAEVVASSLIDHVNSQSSEKGSSLVSSFLNLLFLVTGKSDNNCKCQFPVFLKERYFSEGFPELKRNKGTTVIAKATIPRVIKSEVITKLVLGLKIDPTVQKTFLIKYINFILNEEEYWRSFKAIGLGYSKAKSIGYGLDYLLPLVVFQLRGSLSATGGHEPENILRSLMREWGLINNEDFNMTDHIIKASENTVEEEETTENSVAESKTKTRAYDFIIPLNSVNVIQKILIQSQFYAGDSGSVSHKNIDQTRNARTYTKSIVEDVLFVEFLDGAGYYSSLNGDLKKLLQMNDTLDFFQLRTAAIKLRRILQNIGFLTPLEVVHTIACCMGKQKETISSLKEQGYSETEITSAIDKSVKNGLVSLNGSNYEIATTYREVARRYFLLDCIAENGIEFDHSKVITGAILIPGYSWTFGIKLNEVATDIIPKAGLFAIDWKDSKTIFNDIQFLADRRWIIQC